MKIGLEVEFFAKKGDEIVIPNSFGIPTDEYPILVEARGEPFSCAFKAIGSVRAEIDRIVNSLMAKHGLTPLFENWLKKDNKIEELHQKVLRAGLHKHIAYENLYNKPISRKNKKFVSAGLHVSFTNEQYHNYKYLDHNKHEQSATFTYNPIFDYVQIFRKIEREFATEIKSSERQPGFYEIKGDGRIEYRSLPATLIHDTNFAARLNKCI